ncbi:phage regulatory CII family protein [Pseudoalteromonas sp. SCSIO 43088]|uniref:phage regulatory CII family protein n=1 Tax=Pseudoalteromonas sp. SCSIO 43088 TaxID=2822846 RepID=UPI00202B0514|nr:phage regulatory CII family protein [Pseudoalteromonas sp. SCSIO 43088]URQ87706.1 phage regulatory CII family protein [Pseudoalteromonas sp. SCSIO 43088]
MLLSKKGTCAHAPVTRCPMAAAESFKNDYNIAELARQMGVNPTVLRSKLDDSCDTHILGYRQIIAMSDLTQDYRSLEAWAFSVGKTVVDLPDVGLSDEELADQILQLQAGCGDFARAVHISRSDGVITESNFDVIQKRAQQAITAILHVTAELEQMVRPDPNEPDSVKATSLKVA